MKLHLVKSEWLDDWYIIVRTDVIPQQWIEKVGKNGLVLRDSTRISDADVEGTAEEMLAIADAIERHDFKAFRRCAVDAMTDMVQFWSPRNSREEGQCTYTEALDLAKNIRGVIGEAK